MSQYTIPCFICNTPLQNIFVDADNQPSEATRFHTRGHYGSTAFDPMDGSMIELNICDHCLVERKERVLWRKESRPVTCGKWGIVGWQELVDRHPCEWTGVGSHDTSDRLEVDWQAVGNPDFDKRVHWQVDGPLHGPDPYVVPE